MYISLDTSFISFSNKSVWGDYLQESESYFHQVVFFYSLVSCGLAVSTMYRSSAELDEGRYHDESESFVPYFESCWLFFDILSVLETGLRPKVLATNNKFTNVVVPFLAVTDKQTNIMFLLKTPYGWINIFLCFWPLSLIKNRTLYPFVRVYICWVISRTGNPITFGSCFQMPFSVGLLFSSGKKCYAFKCHHDTGEIRKTRSRLV